MRACTRQRTQTTWRRCSTSTAPSRMSATGTLLALPSPCCPPMHSNCAGWAARRARCAAVCIIMPDTCVHHHALHVCASSCLTPPLPRTFLEPLGIIDLVATQLLTRIMNNYLAKPMPDQDRFLRRFIQVRAACGGLRCACVCAQECMRVWLHALALPQPVNAACSRATAPLPELKLRLLNRGLRRYLYV